MYEHLYSDEPQERVTCDAILTMADVVRSERVRAFQPPWETVYVMACPVCGQEIRIRKNWNGPAPNGGIRCGSAYYAPNPA